VRVRGTWRARAVYLFARLLRVPVALELWP
jgi:hypothetical protein